MSLRHTIVYKAKAAIHQEFRPFNLKQYTLYSIVLNFGL